MTARDMSRTSVTSPATWCIQATVSQELRECRMVRKPADYSRLAPCLPTRQACPQLRHCERARRGGMPRYVVDAPQLLDASTTLAPGRPCGLFIDRHHPLVQELR